MTEHHLDRSARRCAGRVWWRPEDRPQGRWRRPAAAADRTKSENTTAGKAEPKREVSKDAKNDYEARDARSSPRTTRRTAGTSRRCRQARPTSSPRSCAAHPDLVEAQFMVGLSLPPLQPVERRREGVPGRVAHQAEPRRRRCRTSARSTTAPARSTTRAVLGERDQGERQADRRAQQHRVARARGDAQDQQRQGRELEEARGGRAVQPVERARRRQRQRQGVHAVRPGLHGGLRRRTRTASTSRSCCSTRRRSATRSTRRCRTRTACYYMHRNVAQRGAPALHGRGRGGPEVRRGAHERRPDHARLPQVRHREGAVHARSIELDAEELRRVSSAWASRCAASRTLDGAEAQYKKAQASSTAAAATPTTTSASSTRTSGEQGSRPQGVAWRSTARRRTSSSSSSTRRRRRRQGRGQGADRAVRQDDHPDRRSS